MRSTLISIDIHPKYPIKKEFFGSIVRGWFGSLLRCNTTKDCRNCHDLFDCPYYMIFKEMVDVKPYSLLSFQYGEKIRNLIRIHGERSRFVPMIVDKINTKGRNAHFNGIPYSIDEIRVHEIETANFKLGAITEILLLSPLCLKHNNTMEMIPTFNSFFKACVRSYNRITKYYDRENYPLRIDEKLRDTAAPITKYDVRSMKMIHECMDDRKIPLEGIMGSFQYDTSLVSPEVGKILKFGELLQIGKHTTYGLGGILIKTR